MAAGSLGLGAAVPTDPRGAPAWLRSNEDVDVMEFTLPDDMVGLRWPRSGRPDSHKTFLLREPTPEIERKAQNRASSRPGFADMGSVVEALIESTLYAIGGTKTNQNHDTIHAWLKDIGPKGRQGVQNAYGSLASVEDDAMERFLATGTVPSR